MPKAATKHAPAAASLPAELDRYARLAQGLKRPAAALPASLALGGAFLAALQPVTVHAQQCAAPSQKVIGGIVNGCPDIYLDLDDDGDADFNLFKAIDGGIAMYNLGDVSVSGSVVNGYLYPYNVAAGSPITAGGAFANLETHFLLNGAGNRGHFPANSGGNIAVKLNNHLGFVELTVDGNRCITVGDFGLQADPNIAVTAGDCGSLPVELTRFEARVDQDQVHLSWQTATETNNAGFEIQHAAEPDQRVTRSDVPVVQSSRQRRGAPRKGSQQRAVLSTALRADASPEWQVLGFVAGHGTTSEAQSYTFVTPGLAPGRHRFRLKQVDFDGAFEFSPQVEATVELATAYQLSPAYPNPFGATQATFTLAVKQAQHVEVAAFDVLGRRVAVLFDAVLPANVQHTLTFDGAGLSSGSYVIRADGEHFAAQQLVTLVK